MEKITKKLVHTFQFHGKLDASMVSFTILITLCAAASCTKYQNSVVHSLRQKGGTTASNRRDHSPKNVSSTSSANPYKSSRPQDVNPNPDEKDGMVLVLLEIPGKRAETSYPKIRKSISDKLNDVSYDKFKPYGSSNPREMDALVDSYGYSGNPFSAGSSHLPDQTRDGASDPIYSVYSEANDKISTLHVAQKHMPSPYIDSRNVPIDLTYLPIETSPKNTSQVVPQWSLFPEKVEYIMRVLKKNMEMTSISNVKLQFAVMQQYPPWVHYTLLLTVCSELINDVVSKGEDAFDLNFDETIIMAVNKVTDNPQDAAEKIKRKFDKTSESIAPILRYINNVVQSEVCFTAVECDTMIEHALIQTSNLSLKLQAILLQATINLADIFMNQHAEDFEQVSKEHKAFEYVFSVDSRELAPLVAAGYTVKMIRKYLNPPDTSVPFKW